VGFLRLFVDQDIGYVHMRSMYVYIGRYVRTVLQNPSWSDMYSRSHCSNSQSIHEPIKHEEQTNASVLASVHPFT